MGKYALELNGVTKQYKDFKLDSISFTVPQGSIVGLIGENGAGKSTTINAILGLIVTEQGKISVFNGKDVNAETKEHIGVVFDGSNYPDNLTPKKLGKVFQNIYAFPGKFFSAHNCRNPGRAAGNGSGAYSACRIGYGYFLAV